METQKIFYSSDVSLEEHSNFIVFKNFDGLIESVFIERLEDTEQVILYNIELFDMVNESWINENDLESLNNTMDTSYKFNEFLTLDQKILFSQDLCNYFGAVCFDQYPNNFYQWSFETWLKERNLIEA